MSILQVSQLLLVNGQFFCGFMGGETPPILTIVGNREQGIGNREHRNTGTELKVFLCMVF
jgi:hypothetical protein